MQGSIVAAYLDICDRFRLPRDEAQDVAGEIESHTGLVIQSGAAHYEFSHLSLQEFLCAEYLVKDPFSDRLRGFLEVYPAPVAVAVSLASDPSWFLAAMFLGETTATQPELERVSAFLTRLKAERPRFSPEGFLGFALIDLLLRFGDKILEPVQELANDPAVSDSLSLALRTYKWGGDQQTGALLSWTETRPLSKARLRIPHGGPLARACAIFLKRLTADVPPR